MDYPPVFEVRECLAVLGCRTATGSQMMQEEPLPLPLQPGLIPRSSQNKVKVDQIFLRQAEEGSAWLMKWDGQRLSCLCHQQGWGLWEVRADALWSAERVMIMGITRTVMLGWAVTSARKNGTETAGMWPAQLYFVYGNCKGCNKVAYMHLSHTRQLSLDNCKGESKLNGN